MYQPPPASGVRIKHIRHVVEICAFVLAGIWACYVFIYEERIKPLSQPVRLNVSASYDVGGTGKFQIVTLKVQLHNVGVKILDVAAEGISAYGMQIGVPGAHRTTQPPSWDVEPQEYLKQTALLLSAGTLRGGAVGGAPNRHVYLRADESTEYRCTVVVPRQKFAAIKFGWIIVNDAAPIVPRIKVPLIRTRDGAYNISGGPQISGELIARL